MNIAEIATQAAKGAAAGSIVPGVGTALGAVTGVLLDIAPEVGRWLFGSDAASTIQQVKQTVEQVTGTTDPEAQVSALADPQIAADLRVQLAQIAADRAGASEQAQVAMLNDRLADVANARQQTVTLSQQGSAIAWGAPAVSGLVLMAFGSALVAVLTRALPQGSADVANIMLGTLGAMATSVVSYWVGSSAGSARKDARLAAIGDRSS